MYVNARTFINNYPVSDVCPEKKEEASRREIGEEEGDGGERDSPRVPVAPIYSRIIWSRNKYWSGRNWWRITFWRRASPVRFGRPIVSRSFLPFSTHAGRTNNRERARAREAPLARAKWRSLVKATSFPSLALFPVQLSTDVRHSVVHRRPPIATLFSEATNSPGGQAAVFYGAPRIYPNRRNFIEATRMQRKKEKSNVFMKKTEADILK